MTGVLGLNHLTLAVANLDASLHFYVELLGAQAKVRWAKGAYLCLGDVWLCLSVSSEKMATSGYTHYAFSVAAEHFAPLREALLANGVREWQANTSEGDSFYFLDPDGHQLELHVGDLDSRLASLKRTPYDGLQWF